MSELGPLDGDVEELDGSRALRDPGPRRLPHASGVRRRPRRGVLAPRRRRELRGAARGGRRDPLDRARRRARPARTGCGEPSSATAAGCSRAGTTTFEGKSGYGLDRETELASLRAIARRRRRPDLARRPRGRRPSSRTPTPTSTSLLADVLPDAAAARRGGRRLPRARRLRRRPGAPLPRGVPRARPRAAPARRPVHRGGRDPARDRARRPLGRPPRGDRARTASPRSPRATSPACCCPRARSSSAGRCRPARALVDAGAAVALATDFNPGSAFCESLPLVLLARRDAARAQPGRGARRVHRQRRARARPRRPARAARARLRRRPRRCSTRPTGATSPTTSRGDVVATVVKDGAASPERAAY